MRSLLWCCLLILFLPLQVVACIQDGFSSAFKTRFSGGASQKLSDAINGKFAPGVSARVIQKRLKELNGAPQPNTALWWINLSGAHLRLGEAGKAAELLEQVKDRFQDEYAIHSNLGTAYHLLGRYAEAEEEIRRGLQINPEAHEGLEYYHLALLQYLVRDHEYQARHLYVDEWTEAFAGIEESHNLSFSPRGTILSTHGKPYRSSLLWNDEPPSYRYLADLGKGPDFIDGIIYMASLNQKEPSVFTMLGVAALHQNDGKAAQKAFERAIKLGAPNADALRLVVDKIKRLRADDRLVAAVEGRGAGWIVVIMIAAAVILAIRFARRTYVS